jgi:hypothetical protein
MDPTRASHASLVDLRIVAAMLFERAVPNATQPLHLELDEEGLADLRKAVDDTTERLRGVSAASDQRREAEGLGRPTVPATVAIGFRRSK